MAKKKDRYVVGLDIGTHKVCAIVAEITDEGRLDVIGIGQAESKGLRKGVVINLEATVESIKRVVEEAELMAGVEIGSAYVGLAGTHIRGFNSRGVIAVSGKNRDHRARGRAPRHRGGQGGLHPHGPRDPARAARRSSWWTTRTASATPPA